MAYKKCDNCGESKKDVEEDWDPFLLEIHDEKVSMKLCRNCYQERINDI